MTSSDGVTAIRDEHEGECASGAPGSVFYSFSVAAIEI